MQARTILLQTGLAQQTLAAVWNISDIDKVRTRTDISRIFLLFFLYYIYLMLAESVASARMYLVVEHATYVK